MTTLSLIIPCYICERTLEDAVASVYRQESPLPFSVTMVDDGSTDETYAVMRRLATRYPHIGLVRHPQNLGGGATRNTAVANSEGDIIFCLDSDDILGEDFLRNLVGYWLEKRCDGVGIGRSIKFKKTDLNDVAYVSEFARPGEQVPFESLLDGSECSLYSTFLITREAFNQIGGYPTAHGFDTQGMAWRFLSNGLVAYTCPDAVYHHRVSFHKSYFVREDRARRYNWNWLLILTEFLYLFSDASKDLILTRELVPSEAAATLDKAVCLGATRHPIFASNYADLIRKGRDRVAEELHASDDPFDQYWLGEYWLSKDAPAKALDHFRAALDAQFSYGMIFCRLVEAGMRTSGAIHRMTFTYPRMRLRVSREGLEFEAIVAPLPIYQRFENWLMRYRGTRPLGRALKWTRLQFRRVRGAP
jgi:glycosyltransferase involved in cell wall biosynthesis